MRSPKELLRATRPFAREVRWQSWWHLLTTILALAIPLAICRLDWPWYARLPFSILAGLVTVRLFIIFHDHQHGAILQNSRLVNGLMTVFGLLSLNPSSVWKATHDHHHHHNSKDLYPNIGSFPVLTVDQYRQASFWKRLGYRVARHPLTVVFGYVTVFLGSMTTLAFFKNPRRHYDAVFAVLSHVSAIWLLFASWDDRILGAILPFAIASGLGAYLFYAQHNFPGVKLHTKGNWDYVSAALRSSSFCDMSPMMHWFTGNIGYHHVHHLNAKIPYYRLPEAMAALPELQSPNVTSLAPWDVLACLRLKLWDPASETMVPWPKRPVEQPAVLESLVEAVEAPRQRATS